MAKTRVIQVGDPEPERSGSGIDPRDGTTVLYYVEGQIAPAEVPARDLNGGDLDRIAYVRRFRAGDGEVPSPLAEGELDALADELVAGGGFSRERQANDTPTEDPAETPAADEVDDDSNTEPEPPAEPEG